MCCFPGQQDRRFRTVTSTRSSWTRRTKLEFPPSSSSWSGPSSTATWSLQRWASLCFHFFFHKTDELELSGKIGDIMEWFVLLMQVWYLQITIKHKSLNQTWAYTTQSFLFFNFFFKQFVALQNYFMVKFCNISIPDVFCCT